MKEELIKTNGRQFSLKKKARKKGDKEVKGFKVLENYEVDVSNLKNNGSEEREV